MPIIARLAALYQQRGIAIVTGLNPAHFAGFPLAPFTWFLKDGASLTNGLGIALQEIYFLECLFARFRPERLFAIGNSLGWSTLALALLNPDGKVVAIDSGDDRNAQFGIELTNEIARAEELKLSVVVGRSPQDVPRVITEHDLAPLQFAFIDGYHSVAQVQADFAALRPHAGADCLYLFHDVISCSLLPGIEKLAAESGLQFAVFSGTPSGMALVWDPAHHATTPADVAPFSATPEMLDFVRDNAWAYRHRHLARWRRSLRKRRPGAKAGQRR